MARRSEIRTHGLKLALSPRAPAVILMFVPCLAVAAQGRSASFVCETAHAPVERVICSDDTLADLDRELGQALRAYLAVAAPARQSRLDEQRTWLKGRLSACSIPATGMLDASVVEKAVGCLVPLYRDRLVAVKSGSGEVKQYGLFIDAIADQQVCVGLADRIRASVPGNDGQPGSVLEELSGNKDGFVRLDSEGSEIDDLDHQSRLRLTPDQTSDLKDFSSHSVLRLLKFGNSSIVAAEIVGGTGKCQGFKFFDSSTDPAKEIEAPEASDESSYCWGDSNGDFATIGAVAGHPAFAVEEFRGGNEDIRLISLKNSRWRLSCRLGAFWKFRFDVAGGGCESTLCRGFSSLAPEIVRTYDLDGDVSSFWEHVKSPTTPENALRLIATYPELHRYWTVKFSRGLETVLESGEQLTRIFEDDGKIRVEDIKSTPETMKFDGVEIPGYPFYTFGNDSTILPVKIEDRTYLARVGHGHFGWRTTDDYLVELFDWTKDGFEPLGGLLVYKRRNGHPEVNVQ